MNPRRILLGLCGFIALLALVACNGGGDPPGAGSGGGNDSPKPGEATEFSFDLSSYAPVKANSNTTAQSAANDFVTVQGQLLAVPGGGGSERVFRFAIRIDEGAAQVIEEFNLNLPTGVYDFYVILDNGQSSYGATTLPDSIAIIGGGTNLVRFVMYPVVPAITDVRVFRDLVASSPPRDLTYDLNQVSTTRPKLELTLEDGLTLVYVVNPNPLAPTIRLYGSGGLISHKFYYGKVVVTAPVDSGAGNDATPTLQYIIDDPCFAANTCNESVLIDDQVTTARNGDELPVLGDGNHDLIVIFTDQDGTSRTVTLSFFIDATPPVVVVEDPNSGGGVQDGGTVNGDSGDVTVTTNEGGSLSIYLDPDSACLDAVQLGGDVALLCRGYVVASYSDVSANQTISESVIGLALGEHTLYVVAVDDLGNQTVQEVHFTVVPDNAPSIQISLPGGTLYPSRTVPFGFTASDDFTPVGQLIYSVQVQRYDAVLDAYVDAGADVAADSITVNADGEFRVTVAVSDDASPVNTSTASRRFWVDTTPPDVAILAPADGGKVATGNPQLDVNVIEQSLSTVSIYLFAGALRLYDASDLLDIPLGGMLQQQNGQPLSDGQWTVVVEVKDAVQLTGSDHSTFTVNAVGPFVAILNPTDGEVLTNGQANLKYSVHDASHVEVWLASASDPNPASPLMVREINPVQPVPRTYQDSIDLPLDGDYTITLVARDVDLPNVTAEASVHFSMDRFNPGVQISQPGDETLYVKHGVTVPLAFTATNATGYQVLVDNVLVGEGALTTSPESVAMQLGPYETDAGHTVKVKVSDSHSSGTDSAFFVIDGTDPNVLILSPADQATLKSDSVTLVYGVEEANGIKEHRVWLDSVLQAGATSGVTFTDLSLGVWHTLEVQVVDLADNVSNVAGVSVFVQNREEDDDDDDDGHGRRTCMKTPIHGKRDLLWKLLRCVHERHDNGGGNDDVDQRHDYGYDKHHWWKKR